MNGPEHYAEAERLARDALTYEGLPSNAHIQLAQVAQVHATLALAAATVGPWLVGTDLHAWRFTACEVTR